MCGREGLFENPSITNATGTKVWTWNKITNRMHRDENILCVNIELFASEAEAFPL